MLATRADDEIRQSIEANRAELGLAVERLRNEVTKATDWRGHFELHKKEVLIGAAVAGFVAAENTAGSTASATLATTFTGVGTCITLPRPSSSFRRARSSLPYCSLSLGV